MTINWFLFDQFMIQGYIRCDGSGLDVRSHADSVAKSTKNNMLMKEEPESAFVYDGRCHRRMPRLFSLLGTLALFLVVSCDQSSRFGDKLYALADDVTIYRDAFGVPHVHGKTDAATAFGFAYAQAEDNFWQIENNFVRAIGRAAELDGEDMLQSDWLNRALQTESLSILEYEQSDEHIRGILDGFASGLNHFLRSRPDTEPRFFDHFEPWYPLALIRYLYYQRGFLRSAGVYSKDFDEAMRVSSNELLSIGDNIDTDTDAAALEESSPSGDLYPRTEQGSNSWAVSPSRSASGNALLFINPHLPFFGPSQVYEGHVISDEGWNFSGYSRLGFPMPYVGFNEHLGWASTDNGADQADAYAEVFDHPDDPLAYRYGDEYRTAETWEEYILVRNGTRLDTLTFQMQKTHHGPVVAMNGAQPVTVRMAKFEEPGWLAQWYAMSRSDNLESFKEAVSALDMLFGNYLYADREGNIYYVYNGAVPRRSEAFNWRGINDGSNPETEWQGYHSIDELPQVLNPSSGWIQNCNGTPFLSTSDGNPIRSNFPSYMVREGDNARSRAARRILSSNDSFTYNAWSKLAYSTFSVRADEEIPGLVDAWQALQQVEPRRAASIREAVEVLRDWDRVSTVESVEMTLFVLAAEQGSLSPSGLQRAISRLENDWGTWHVPWGDINRLQRAQSNGDGLSDDLPSLAVAGVPSWAGAMFTFWSSSPPGQKRRYGTGGNSYVAVVEFGASVRAKSLHPFGASADPTSPFHFNQAEIYASGNFKEAWLTLEDVKANASRAYRPGD